MQSFATTLLAFTPPPSGTRDANADSKAMFTQFTMLGFMALVFWLLIIRPQQKKAREQTDLLKQLKRNDRVVTSAGLVGIVLNVRDDSITLRTGDSTVEVTKTSIAQVTEKAA